MRDIQIISVNHKTHNSDDRIFLNLEDENWKRLFSFLNFKLGVDGYVLLQTCNRLELFYESHENQSQAIIEKWLSLTSDSKRVDVASFQVFSGYHDCINHLLNLSVGFKSAIYGDDQILSQLKKAFEIARSSNSMSTLLERAYQSIMRFHKQVCRETDFKSHTVSLAYQALKSAKTMFSAERLQQKKVLIIGAGDMAAQVVKYSAKFRFGSISITNRTASKAIHLVRNTNIEVVPYETLDTSNYDLIISCTDQGFHLISDWSKVEYYIDLSLYSSQIGQINAPYILLNELQELINVQNLARMESVDKVNSILKTKTSEYTIWCKGWIERLVAAL